MLLGMVLTIADFTNGETSFDFSFQDLAADSDHLDTNMTAEEIRHIITYDHNSFQMAQPDVGSGMPVSSSWFAVVEHDVDDYVQAGADRVQSEKDSSDKKWRLGVGIGVGLGVPLLMAAAFFGGLRMGRGRSVKTVESG